MQCSKNQQIILYDVHLMRNFDLKRFYHEYSKPTFRNTFCYF